MGLEQGLLGVMVVRWGWHHLQDLMQGLHLHPQQRGLSLQGVEEALEPQQGLTLKAGVCAASKKGLDLCLWVCPWQCWWSGSDPGLLLMTRGVTGMEQQQPVCWGAVGPAQCSAVWMWVHCLATEALAAVACRGVAVVHQQVASPSAVVQPGAAAWMASGAVVLGGGAAASQPEQSVGVHGDPGGVAADPSASPVAAWGLGEGMQAAARGTLQVACFEMAA